MKRTCLAVLACAFLVASLAAGQEARGTARATQRTPGCAVSGAGEASGPSFLRSGDAPIAPEERVFLDLTPFPAGSRVAIQYRVDDHPYVTEEFVVPGMDKGAPTVRSSRRALAEDLSSTSPAPPELEIFGVRATELLALAPERMQEIQRFAASRPDRVHVEISVDGESYLSAAFEDLQVASRQLQKSGYTPWVTSPRMTDHTRRPAVPVEKGACEDQCYQDFYDCQNQGCGNPDEWTCTICNSNLDSCLYNCNPPPPPTCTPKEEYYWTNWYNAGSGSTGNWICGNWIDGTYHDFLVLFTDSRRDYKKKTTYSNCTTSESIVQYQIIRSYCYRVTFYSCSSWPPYYITNYC